MTGKLLAGVAGMGVVGGFLVYPVGPRAARPARTPSDSASVVFRDVTVLPMTGPVALSHQSVVVRGDRIIAVGAVDAIAVPPGATVLDGAGKYLMPGLADMHVHLPGGQDSLGLQTRNALTLFVANGVTTIRVLNGTARHLTWRDLVAGGRVTGPRIYVVGSAVGATPGDTQDLRRVMSPGETQEFVRRMRHADFDFIQVTGNLMRQEYDALAGAARRAGIGLTGAVPLDAGLDRVIRARQASIENLDGYLPVLERDDSPIRYADPLTRARELVRYADTARIPRLARSLREAGVANTPTLFINYVTFTSLTAEEMSEWPEMRYVAPTLVADWARRKRRAQAQQPDSAFGEQYLAFRDHLTRGLANAGAPILVGSDALSAYLVPGFATLYEIHSLTHAGLTPAQALHAATRNAAVFLGAGQEFGGVAPGMRADLLLLDADPLADVANLARRAGVMVRGRWFSSQEIQRMLGEVAQSYAPNGSR